MYASTEPSGNLNYALSMRIDRPIAGCETSPHPFLAIKGGSMDNNTRSKLMEANPHDFAIHWSRGPRRSTCAHANCPRRNVFDPVQWSRFACGGPALKCAVCERLKVSREDTTFCSISCFKEAWQQHSSECHTSSKSNQVIRKSEKVEELLEGGEGNSNVDSSNNNSNNSSNNSTNFAASIEDVGSGDDWVEISNDRTYVPTVDDIGCSLRVEVRAYSMHDHSLLAGPAIIFTEPVLAAPQAPPKRQLILVPGALNGATLSARFRIVSYNILAELYATKQAYPYCDSWSLSWPYRRKILFDEIEDSQGDIVCLQELQSDHFESSVNPFMSRLGFDGLFKQKSRESMGLYGKVDGCAIFWRRSKFMLTESYTVDFNECARRAAKSLGLDEGESRRYINRLSKDNIAQVIFLEVVQPNRNPTMRTPRTLLCVANTHLYSNHLRPDVKLWQTCTLIHELEQLIVPRDVPLILCGDFNSEVDSAVYEYLSDGVIERAHPDIEESDAMHILPELRTLSHNLDISSMMFSAMGSEPLFTNYTSGFRGTLDYAWFSTARLRVIGAFSMPEEREIQRDCGEGLPSAMYPSDHIMLCFDVAMVANVAGSITVSRSSHGRGGGGHLGGNNQSQHNNMGFPALTRSKTTPGRLQQGQSTSQQLSR